MKLIDISHLGLKFKRVFPQSWYIIFDGTSYYGVMGVDIEDVFNDNEGDIEIIGNPSSEYPEYEIERLNEEI